MSKGTLDDVFFALSGSTRREILVRLAEGGATVQEIADPFEVSLNTVSKHIKILERAGLVHREVRGREHHCSLRAEPLAEAAEFVRRYEAFWTARLGAMDDLLRSRRAVSSARDSLDES